MGPRLNYADAAKYLGVNPTTLRGMVYRRTVPHIRISARVVVFDVATLDAWLASKAVAAIGGDKVDPRGER